MRTLVLLSAVLLACQPAADGAAGTIGPEGPAGPMGAMGAMGAPGKDGSGATPVALGTSGSRIKYLTAYYVFSDGATAPASRTFYDTKIGVPCAAALTASNVLRCLPAEPGQVRDTGYIDADCTSRLAVGYAAADMPPRYMLEVDHVFAGQRRVRPVSGKIPGLTQIYSMMPNGGGMSCLPRALAVDVVYYATGNEVPATDFVAADQKLLIE